MICTASLGPEWVHDIGIQKAESLSDTNIRISWGDALPRTAGFQVYFNVYMATNRRDVFTDSPSFITSEKSLVIKNLTPGEIYYFGVRAVEAGSDEAQAISELELVGTNSYKYPYTYLSQDLDISGTDIYVEQASDWPPSGAYAIIHGLNDPLEFAEVIKYNFLSVFPFPERLRMTDVTGRALQGTDDGYHSAGSKVTLKIGLEDSNNNLQRATSMWKQPNIPFTADGAIPGDGYLPNVGADGYRSPADLVTADKYRTASDGANTSFDRYDKCGGYHRTDPLELFTGQCVGSYMGGENYGFRGLNLADQLSGRLEFLLENTGEPVILLRRFWTGTQCSCRDARREHHRFRGCPRCYGTGFVGGYEQYFSPRRYDGAILTRFEPTPEDLLIDHDGLHQDYKPAAWTLSTPIIRDRDILIRYDEDGNYEFRYEVLNVTRNKLFYGKPARQQLALQRIDKTDPAYQFVPVHRGDGINNHPIQNDDRTQNFSLKPAGAFPHIHSLVVTGPINNVGNINGETTASVQGDVHTHPVQNGIVMPGGVDFHVHEIDLAIFN